MCLNIIVIRLCMYQFSLHVPDMYFFIFQTIEPWYGVDHHLSEYQPPTIESTTSADTAENHLYHKF